MELVSSLDQIQITLIYHDQSPEKFPDTQPCVISWAPSLVFCFCLITHTLSALGFIYIIPSVYLW